jgi:hypothetical protein
MKKLFLLGLLLFLITGCFNSKIDKEKKLYNNYISELESIKNNSFNNNLPFDINVYLDKIDTEEIMYRVIIDNPKEDINNIEAIAIHNYQTKDIFPTSGIFDDKLNLIPNKIDKDNNIVKGIILIGYIPFNKSIDGFDGTIKVLVAYEDKDSVKHKVYFKY